MHHVNFVPDKMSLMLLLLTVNMHTAFDHALCLYIVGVIKGGNDAHLAPEVRNVRDGSKKYVSYVKQPVWAAGVLAYELSGQKNPFLVGAIDQLAYSDNSLPTLSFTYSTNPSSRQKLPNELGKLVRSMLAYDPTQRPTLSQALQRVQTM